MQGPVQPGLVEMSLHSALLPRVSPPHPPPSPTHTHTHWSSTGWPALAGRPSPLTPSPSSSLPFACAVLGGLLGRAENQLWMLGCIHPPTPGPSTGDLAFPVPPPPQRPVLPTLHRAVEGQGMDAEAESGMRVLPCLCASVSCLIMATPSGCSEEG